MLEDLPLIKPDITVLSPTRIETEVKVENKKLSEIPESNVVIATNLLNKNNVSYFQYYIQLLIQICPN